MLAFEKQAWADGYPCVAGIDEAGRGPWAGPVVAAAVYIEPRTLQKEECALFQDLTDSKKLTPAKRDDFFSILTHHRDVFSGIGLSEPEEIDQINILQATHLAMQRAFEDLKADVDFVLIDGNRIPKLPCPSRAIVKGDAKSLSIAAASIIAKVTRDRILIALDQQYPQYGFARHKGYGTKEHAAALKKYGPLACHRKSFRPIRECLATQQNLF